MTHEDLARLLEQFAVLVLKTHMTGIDADSKYEIIAGGIDTITETVMFCTDKNRAVSPSLN